MHLGAARGFGRIGGRALDRRGGLPLTNPKQTVNADARHRAARRRVLRFVVERETAQTVGQGPQIRAKWETLSRRGDNQEVGLEAATLERVRNSSLVECVAARTIQGGSSTVPTPRVRDAFASCA